MLCLKEIGVTTDEFELMDVGTALDYMQAYIDREEERQKPKSERNRHATQSDFDNF